MDVACGIRSPCADSGRPARRLWRGCSAWRRCCHRCACHGGDREGACACAGFARNGQGNLGHRLQCPGRTKLGGQRKLAERRSVGRMVWSQNRRQRPRDWVADRGVRDWTGVERGDTPGADWPRSPGILGPLWRLPWRRFKGGDSPGAGQPFQPDEFVKSMGTGSQGRFPRSWATFPN